MYLLYMNPEQIRNAVAAKLPLLLPVGAIEYHGEHLPIGTDTLIAEGLCAKINEKAAEKVVIAPAIAMTPTMNWAGGPNDGDIDFSVQALYPYIEEYVRKLVDIGFENIYALICHQGMMGLPATLLQKAGRVIAAEKMKTLGPGWGQTPQKQWPIANAYSVVRLCHYDEFSDYSEIDRNETIPIGHGGRGETQLIMALYTGLVNMNNLNEEAASTLSANQRESSFLKQHKILPNWLTDVNQADLDDGLFWVNFCANGFARHFNLQ